MNRSATAEIRGTIDRPIANLMCSVYLLYLQARTYESSCRQKRRMFPASHELYPKIKQLVHILHYSICWVNLTKL